MSVVVAGTYSGGIVRLKNKVKIPNNTDVLVVFAERGDKDSFLKSAGSWKGVGPDIWDDILASRKEQACR